MINQSHFDHFFSEVRNVFSSDYVELVNSLGISPDTNMAKLPLDKMIKLLNVLDVNFDTLSMSDLDFKYIYDKYKGEVKIPSRYIDELPLSSRFTIQYMEKFISNNYGEHSSKVILQNIQMDKRLLTDTFEKNNMLLPQKFCNFVSHYHGSQALIDMGVSSVDSIESSFLGRLLKKQNSVSKMLVYFFEELAPLYVEKNYIWKILSVDQHRCLLEGKPNFEVVETFGHSNVVSANSEILRAGFLKGLPKLITGSDITVVQLSSICHGDSVDVYEILFINNSLPGNILH